MTTYKHVRLTPDEVFCNMARDLAKLSHCCKTQVGVLITKDGRILSSGVNGTPPGHPNCDDVFSEIFNSETGPTVEQLAEHRAWADRNEIHAELNAINYAAKHGISLDGATMYVTLQPCEQCIKNITVVGIKKIIFISKYDRISKSDEEHILEMLARSNIEIEQLSVSI